MICRRDIAIIADRITAQVLEASEHPEDVAELRTAIVLRLEAEERRQWSSIDYGDDHPSLTAQERSPGLAGAVR